MVRGGVYPNRVDGGQVNALRALTKSHICGRIQIEAVRAVELAKGGDFMHLESRPTKRKRRVEDRPKRGEITCFSPSSRRRMMESVNTADMQAALASPSRRSLFVTLTVHEDEGVAHARLALKRLRDRLRHRFPSVFGWWKLEPQKRGAPHYHLWLIVDMREGGIPVTPKSPDEMGECPFDLWRIHLEQWFLRSWRGCTEQHTITQVRVEDPKSANGMKRYLSKYLGKAVDVPEHWRCNRYWGTWGEIPRTTVRCELSDSQAFKLRRIVRSLVRSRKRAAHRAKGVAGARPSKLWRDQAGGMRAFISYDVSLRILEHLGVTRGDMRAGPPSCMGGEHSCRDGANEPAARH